METENSIEATNVTSSRPERLATWWSESKSAANLRKALGVLLFVVVAGAVVKVVYEVLWHLGWGFYQLFFRNGRALWQRDGSDFKEVLPADEVMIDGWAAVVGLAIIGLCLCWWVIATVRDSIRYKKLRSAQERSLEIVVAHEKGVMAGVAQEEAIVHKAIIHAYKPKRTDMPRVPDGKRRIFWIELTLKNREPRPTRNRAIMWLDVGDTFEPRHLIGAPSYDPIVSEDDRLAFMGVVYTLSREPYTG